MKLGTINNNIKNKKREREEITVISNLNHPIQYKFNHFKYAQRQDKTTKPRKHHPPPPPMNNQRKARLSP